MARLARSFLQLEHLEDRTTPATFTVNTTADTLVSETLRKAITDANAAGGANTINFDSSLAGQSIAIVGTALPPITGTLTITGLGQTSLTISGSNLFTVFNVAAGASATITDLTITKGNGVAAGAGGGILDNGSLIVTRDTLTGNSAVEGGGLFQFPTSTLLNVSDCTITGNTANGGAGVWIEAATGATATISNSDISSNSLNGGNITIFNLNNNVKTTITNSNISNATGNAGVIIADTGTGTVTLDGDTIAGNHSVVPGGGVNSVVGNASIIIIEDCTIVGNTTTMGGGGISHLGTGLLSVFDSTITGNSATGAGGGISVGTAIPFVLANTVVAGNSATTNPDVSATIPAANVPASGFNYIGNTTGFLPLSASITTGTSNDPMLGPLQNNGGPTMTELPITGSPLINAGSNTLVPSTLLTDQRGIGRFIGPALPSTTTPVVDIGSVEYQPQLMVVSGQTNGTAQTYTFNASGVPQAVGSPFTPFSGFNGPVRSVTADVNGDGALDTIYVTGPGTETMVTVISGKDGSTLVAPYDPFGSASNPFTGGGFLAAGDFQGTGKADWVVTPDQGGGPRVVIFSLTGTSVTTLASFFGINDPSFRGGARVAVGDFNGDGTPDLAVAAGFLGGPRVSIYNGLTLFGGTPTNLVPDFFAFGGTDATTLRNGVYLTAGDFNGDGFADLAFGGGPGGGPRALVISGALLTGSGGSAAAEATPMANFFAFDQSQRGGVWLASKFSTGSNLPTLVAASGVGVAPAINAYLGATLTGGTPPSTTFPSFSDPTETFGVFVG